MSEKIQQEHGHGGGYSHTSTIAAAIAIILLMIGYGVMLQQKLPQHWTAEACKAAAHGEEGEQTSETTLAATDEHAEHAHSHESEAALTETEAALKLISGALEQASPETQAALKLISDAVLPANYPPLWMIAPFAILLLCIAILPLMSATSHWWESNLHRFYVAAGLGILTLLYYGYISNFSLSGHWPSHYEVGVGASAFDKMKVIFINAIVSEYIPFIVLLFSLFTISGGIRIEGNLKASPLTNSAIFAIGSLLASFVGTTGAAMLLIRLLLETNKERKYKAHTVVFFIFCVCNCGGCLLPIGDPPLFLGYLMGVNFLFTLVLWKEWLFVNFLIIAVYFILDSLFFYSREAKSDKIKDASETSSLKIKGLWLNLPLLVGVILGVALLDPIKTLPGTDIHPPYFLREAVQLALCAISLLFSSRMIRKANEFNFGAIVEVAVLFFGIFICMQAPLQILNEKGDQLGVETPVQFFWATGTLSSVLDNAPTYVVFFEAAKAIYKREVKEGIVSKEQMMLHKKEVGVAIDPYLLIAVSLGAVFMGAMTYIGNGPNFMVKAIAEQSGVKMPSFFGYMVYSCLILLPIFVAMNMLFIAGHGASAEHENHEVPPAAVQQAEH